MQGKVLIIEEKHSSAVELAGSLSSAGFSVARVPFHPGTMLVLDVLSPDIIIIDETLAIDSEFYHWVKNIVKIPVMVVCTAESAKARPEGFREEYGDSCLEKPFDEAELVGKVGEMMRRRVRYPLRGGSRRARGGCGRGE